MIKTLSFLFLLLASITIESKTIAVSAEKSNFFCNPPSNIQIGNITPTSATVTWTLDPGSIANTVRLRPVGNYPWVIFTPANGQNFVNFNGLMTCASYEVQVSSECSSGNSQYSSSVFFTTLPPDVCTSASVDSGLMHVSNVTVTPSGPGLSPMVSNSGTSNYTDYRPDLTRKVTLVTGSANNLISITKAGTITPAAAHVMVWIDFNGNGIFEASERPLVSTSNTNATVSGYFSVPVFTAKCEVVMRVIYSNDPVTNGCGNFAYGEVEDYGVIFTNLSNLATSETEKTKSFNVYPNPVSDKLFVSGISSDEHYEIFSMTGQLLKKGKTSKLMVDVHDLVKGTYFIKIKNNKEKFIKK